MQTKNPQIPSHWLNHGEMAAACGVSPQAFDKWRVKPVAAVGRERFYLVADVVANRLARRELMGARYINRARRNSQQSEATSGV